MEQIKIGTLISSNEALSVIPDIVDYGFETFSITFWKTIGETNIQELARRLMDFLALKEFFRTLAFSCWGFARQLKLRSVVYRV